MDDIKLFAKTEKKLETLIKAATIQDTGIEFGIEKCHANNENPEKTDSGRIAQPNQGEKRTLGKKETYKCFLGLLETDIIKQTKVKEKIKKEYLWRKKKLLEIKL